MKHIRALLCCLSVSLLAACGGGGGSGAPTVAMVAVNPAMANVMVGQQIQLAGTATDAMGNVLTGQLTWSSSNSAVATVNSTGLVSAVTLGQVTITATTRGQSGTATLTTTTGIQFASVTTGNNHTCGVTPTGVAYCWGDNSSGQLGNGTTTNSATPVPVSGGLTFAFVSAGGQHTCGVTSFPSNSFVGGTLYCWGDNAFGQLGDGTTTNSATPVAVSGGGLFFDLSAGSRHTCAISGLYVRYCWGDNSFGQLGNGTTTNSATPVAVSGVISGGFWTQVSAGSSHTCSVFQPENFPTSSSAYCWGDNSAGQFGNGTTTSSSVPVSVFGATFVSVGTLYTCAKAVVNVTCSGNNTYGQLGNGTTTSSSSPVAVGPPDPGGGAIYGGISTGAKHACSMGNLIPPSCWGDNSSGQLGNGTTTNSATPIVVAGGLNLAVVSAGGLHTCAITLTNLNGGPNAGAVYCWGDNTYGQLGNSWTTSSSVPVNVAGSL